MKTLTNFFEKTNLLIVWFVMSIVLGLLFYCFLKLMVGDAPLPPTARPHPFEWISLGVGVIMGLLVMCMTGLSRMAKVFWEGADELDKLIDETNTKDGLTILWNEKLVPLSHKGGHHSMSARLRELATKLETKQKYITE